MPCMRLYTKALSQIEKVRASNLITVCLLDKWRVKAIHGVFMPSAIPLPPQMIRTLRNGFSWFPSFIDDCLKREDCLFG